MSSETETDIIEEKVEEKLNVSSFVQTKTYISMIPI
jgi:hypothetical protein